MVINLKRRSQRLQRFGAALLKDEPWLLRGNSVCRVPGRDGEEFASAISQVSTVEFERARTQAKNASSSAHHGVLPPVPESLQDPVALLANGWITEEAIVQAGAAQDVWPKMTAGGVGLYLSHAAAWQHVVDMNLDYGLVFEDDLTLFAPSFQDNVSSILSSGNQWWDLMYLQRCDDKSWLKRRVANHIPGYKSRIPRAVLEARSVVEPIDAEDLIPCTGAYIITRQGAEKLLSGAIPAHEQLDVQIGRLSNLKRAALSPPVAQCWEIVENKDGHLERDTDVQTNSENDPDYLYWRQQHDKLEKWTKEWNDRRREEWAESRMGRKFREGHAANAVAMHAVLPDIQDCAHK
jgi:hypothetical protein